MNAANSTDIEVVLAEREILRLLHMYCRAIDRLDRELLESAYHSGAIDDHGTLVGIAEDFISYVLERLPQAYSATQHTLSNISIDIDIDRGTAWSESYVTADHVLELADGGATIYTFSGRYVDRLDRRHGAWRIAHRQLLRTWDGIRSTTRTVDGSLYQLPNPSPHADGVRSAEDPSYRRH